MRGGSAAHALPPQSSTRARFSGFDTRLSVARTRVQGRGGSVTKEGRLLFGLFRTDELIRVAPGTRPVTMPS